MAFPGAAMRTSTTDRQKIELTIASLALAISTLLSGCSASFNLSNATTSIFSRAGVAVTNTVIPPINSPLTRSFFGMTVQHLDAASDAAGATPFPSVDVSTLRFWDVSYWANLEPAEGVYTWSEMDSIVAEAKLNGANDFVFTFGHVPQWAATNPSDSCTDGEGIATCTPPKVDAFDSFATKVVQRYCGKVQYYETWNEPNLAYFWDGTNSQLLQLASHLYSIAKDPANCGCANGICAPNGGVNPNKVLMPTISNLSSAAQAWLDSYLGSVGGNYPYADIASFHGYGETAPESLIGDLAFFKKILAKYGLAKADLWDTEASWGEETAAVNQTQAAWLMRFHIVHAATGISRFIWYAYDSCQWGTLWAQNNCTPSGAVAGTSSGLTLPGQAYGVIQSWLTGATLDSCQQYKDGLWACQMTMPENSTALLLWSTAANPITVTMPANSSLTTYRNWMNRQSSLPVKLPVDSTPVLLEAAAQ
jgi:hypothetical protein